MRLLLTGNNDGPLRLTRSLAAAGGPRPLAIALQKPVDGALARTYDSLPGQPAVHICPDEAATLAICSELAPTLIVNAFANYRFRKLLHVAPCLNVHLAPLPRYRGRHPLHWALINGEASFGVTLHEMNAKWDDGAIVWRATVNVPPLSSVAELREQLMGAVDRGAGQAVAAYAKTLHDADAAPTTQANPAAEGSYVPRRQPGDSELTEWDDPALVVRKVMALRSERDVAYLVVDGQRIEVRRAAFASTPEPEDKGMSGLKTTDLGDRLLVRTPAGASVELSHLERRDR